MNTWLSLPADGHFNLRIISPTILEVSHVNSKPPDPARVDSWDFVGSEYQLQLPLPGQFLVTANGVTVSVQAVGFKRRALYAPLSHRDLRIGNCLYLQLATPVANNQTVQVRNPNATLWPTSVQLTAVADPLRYSPAIHVNQAGYVPEFPKKAMVGYYLGSLGELAVSSQAGFKLVNVQTSATVYQGSLVARPDVGFTDNPAPYQKVLEADFGSFTNAGQYQLVVPGLGASFPFRIDEGVAMCYARTYALGLYHQRCGTSNALPFTRFVHDPCHTAPAYVPSPQSEYPFTWYDISAYATSLNPDNPPQIAPLLTNEAAQLYPFVIQGAVDVSGGHHDAGDYSKYTINSAALIHHLVFAADAFSGAGALDNLGLPESGDGKSDLLQEAKWEADFLAKMQDADGGFYFLVYPRDREYENNVLPDHGDPQVVWPKNTAATAAAVAALAECASSPLFKQQFPAAAALYMQKAQLGWSFLTNAIARYGKAGAYQKLTSYGDDFTHEDELAWAACEMFLATGNQSYQQKFLDWFPNPNDPSTWHWGWQHLFASYGCAIRSYAFAVQIGRVSASQLNTNYLARCQAEIAAGANDLLSWVQASAYGTSYDFRDKAVDSASWYFSGERAFDLSVAYQLNPRADYLDAILSNFNYQGGCNPVNVCLLTGLGWKRQYETVCQYAQNDRRVLPPSGIPLGTLQSGFQFLQNYGAELGELNYPQDSATVAPYPLYDRWGDSYNVATEFVSVYQARNLATMAFLSALTSLRTQAWQAAPALIVGPPSRISTNSAVTAQLQAGALDLSQALVVWEGRDLQPVFATNRLTCTPTNYGPQWLEAEAQWPDGRRAFGVASFFATNNLPTVSVIATVSNVTAGATAPGQFTFYRADNTNKAVTVPFQLSGTATKFIDYRTPQGDMPQSVTIPAGATSLVLSVLAVDHGAPQGRKSIVLTLSTNSAFNVGSPNTATMSISDNVRIASARLAPAGGFTMTWTSLPGSVYQVMSKNNLSDPAWKSLSEYIVATSTTTSWTDTSTAGVPQRFYTVRLVIGNAVPVVTLAPDADGVTGMTLTWSSQAGVVYRVVCKNNLLEPRWSVLSPPITATSDTTSWTDFTTTGVPQRFYGVQALYPGPAQVVSIVGTPSRGITLTWSSLPGSLYEVVYKNNLGDSAWTPLSGNITAAAMLTSWTDYSAAGAPQRFYSVRTTR